jgi:hypothetical protein
MQTRRLNYAWLFAIATAFACSGCHVTSEQLIAGTYRAESPCATIILEVNRDHSFVQSVRTRSSEIKQLKGKWRIRQWEADHQGVKTVDFEPFLDFREDWHGREGGQGETGFRPEWWPRGVLMGPIIMKCPDSAYEIDYVK